MQTILIFAFVRRHYEIIKLIIAFIGTVCISSSTAQYQFGKYLDINAGYGTFMPHKQAVQHLQSGPSFVGEVAYTLRTNGSDFHHKPYKLPYFGVIFGFADGGNRDLIGYESYITAYGGLPLYKSDHPITLKLGMGLGYVQKIYNKYSNPKQNAIGSHFNVNLQFRLEKNFQLAEGGGINFGLGVSHYSNASYQTPNLGLNYFHFYVGKRFELQKCIPIPDSIPVIAILPYTPRKIEMEFHFGIKENIVALGDKYLILNASSYYTKQFSIKHAWSNGLDLYYNPALQYQEDKLFQIGFTSRYVLNFDEIKLGAGLGYYLMGKPDISKGFYSVVFFQHFFGNKWYAKINLRTHRVIADFFTIGIGYAL